jgi:hypothetical protein
MKKRSITVLVAALLCGLLSILSVAEGLVGAVLTNGTLAIARHIIGSGGGHEEVGNYVLDGTIGQVVVGAASNDPYDLCSGFWCGTRGYKIYLPLVMRDFS